MLYVACDRRLPITARLSAVCKVVPPSLQVYFRVLLKEAPPHYIGEQWALLTRSPASACSTWHVTLVVVCPDWPARWSVLADS